MNTNDKKLKRSVSDRKIGGVCGGLAAYLGIDSTLIRIIWLAAIFLVGTGFFLYLICWLVMPEDNMSIY